MNSPTLVLAAASVALYFGVGLVALVMASKSLLGRRLVRFQEEAAQTNWETISLPLRHVIVALMRVAGLGWLVVALLMTVFPVVSLFTRGARVPLLVYGPPAVGLIYCGGLFVVTYNLHRVTKTATPWKGSLIAMTAVALGMLLAVLS